MIINDTERQAKMERINPLIDKQGQAEDTLRVKRADEKFLIEKATPMNQWGRFMTSRVFESKLLKLNPNFRFEKFPPPFENSANKQLFLITKDESLNDIKLRVCLYPAEILPEFSIMRVIQKVLPNPEFVSTGKSPSKFDFSNKPIDWGKNPEEGNPLYQHVVDSKGVQTRGWREVLYICMDAGILTLGEVEKEFGSANSAEWSIKVKGRQHDGRPW